MLSLSAGCWTLSMARIVSDTVGLWSACVGRVLRTLSLWKFTPENARIGKWNYCWPTKASPFTNQQEPSSSVPPSPSCRKNSSLKTFWHESPESHSESSFPKTHSSQRPTLKVSTLHGSYDTWRVPYCSPVASNEVKLEHFKFSDSLMLDPPWIEAEARKPIQMDSSVTPNTVLSTLLGWQTLSPSEILQRTTHVPTITGSNSGVVLSVISLILQKGNVWDSDFAKCMTFSSSTSFFFSLLPTKYPNCPGVFAVAVQRDSSLPLNYELLKISITTEFSFNETISQPTLKDGLETRRQWKQEAQSQLTKRPLCLLIPFH